MYVVAYCSMYVVSYCIMCAQSCPARMLEWVTIFYSRGPSRRRDWISISCVSFTGRWILYHCATWEIVQDLSHNTKVTSIRLGHEKPYRTKEIHILLFLSPFIFSDILCRLLTEPQLTSLPNHDNRIAQWGWFNPLEKIFLSLAHKDKSL